MPRSFALGQRFEAFIDAQVQGGRYNNASEVVREALRLLEDRESLREFRLAEQRRLAQEARDGGPGDEEGPAIPGIVEPKYRTRGGAMDGRQSR